MSAKTSMNDQQKLRALSRLSGLNRTAEELIHGNARSPGDIGVLLEAMQAFKDGKLGAIIRASRNAPAKDIFAVCELEVRNVPFAPEDLRVLIKRGVRYVGEVFYLFFDPKSRFAVERGQRMMEVLTERFGLSQNTDPIALGWTPSYWSDAAFVRELNTLILERHPTPKVPDWEMHLKEVHGSRRMRAIFLEHRGAARFLRRQNIHFVGEILARCGQGQHCPAHMRSASDLETARVSLRAVGSRIWAGALIPRTWSAPSWEGDLWRAELAEIEHEKQDLAAAVDRVRRQEDAERADVQVAKSRRRAELLSSPTPILGRTFEEAGFELSVRCANCLQNANIRTIRELVVHTEAEMLKTKNFSRRNLKELKELLEPLGLRFGMTGKDFEEMSAPSTDD